MTLKEKAVIILDELNKTMSINYNFEDHYLKRIMEALIIINDKEKELDI